MNTISSRKKYNSDICIDGKRIGAMRQLAIAIFEDSFLSIEVQMPERIFIVRLDNEIDPEQLRQFEDKHKLCKVIVYQPIDFSALSGKRK